MGTGTLFVLDKTGVKKTSKKEEKNADSGKGGEEDLFKFCEDQPEKNPRDDADSRVPEPDTDYGYTYDN